MPNIYSTAGSDAWIYKGDSNWSTARDATSGDLIGRTGGGGSRSFTAIQAVVARGTYRVTRSFLFFDTSGISDEPASATLNIYGFGGTGGDLFVVRSDADPEITADEFDEIVGWSGSGVDNESNVTKYSSEITSWSAGAYNTITLNAEALLRIKSEDIFKVCLIESVHDLRNVAPTGFPTSYTGMYFSDWTGTSRDPYLSYTVATAVTDNATFFGTNF